MNDGGSTVPPDAIQLEHRLHDLKRVLAGLSGIDAEEAARFPAERLDVEPACI